RFRLLGRGRRKCQLLRERRRTREHASRQQRGGNKRPADAAAPHVGLRWTSVSRPLHHPSSWYNNAMKPVSPPASTGSQAAAMGYISPALLKSSVTFDKT